MKERIQEKAAWHVSGLPGLVILAALAGVAALTLQRLSVAEEPVNLVLFLLSIFALVVVASGLVILQPNEARVIQFFGHYIGTVRQAGLVLTVPLSTKTRVSLRRRNFESPKLKVNDADGNPVEIGAIVVWQVADSAQAIFNVDTLETFIEKQAESAVRMLATSYPYDRHDEHQFSLHGNINEVNEQLKDQIGARLGEVGVTIIEAKISHLAYAPEIAAAMLQRQQAQAIIAARTKIVEGAVGMVDMALRSLTKNGIIELDEERKAAMVSNLLVVLCSERPSQPVLNTGTIY